MPEKKRLGFIDLAKAIAFMMVVCGHTFLPGSRVRAIIYSFHMPLYFVLAGYTFSKKPMVKAVVNSAKRLILPYALY
ncbi:MAG: acyltransferase family protein, partial [Atopobiaceae bacterium]|nr:acyltransferase family protein [Atopobiaceae bacterium]